MTSSRRGYDSKEQTQGETPDLRPLFHQLNNQLGTALAHAELLEVKAQDATTRARATQVVASVLEAMATAREIRQFSPPIDA